MINTKYKINIAPILILFSAMAAFAGCNREPLLPPQPSLDQISIADLRAMHKGQDIAIDTNVYIQGVITLTPEYNNIPEFIAYIQDSTAAITLTVSGTNSFSLGSEVKILCKGLSVTDYRGLLQLGDIETETKVELVKLTGEMPDAKSVTISELLAGSNIAELVSVGGSEFVESGTFSGSKTLTDCSADIEVYTRSQATFGSDDLPAGNGIFEGVVSVYDDPQLIIVDPTGFDMTGQRCSGGGQGYLAQDFETLADHDPVTNATGWLNPLEAGDRNWQARAYSGNMYAQATAFSSTLSSMISWMISPPVDLSSATSPVLNFDTKTGYHNGAQLDVLVSTDYDGIGSPWSFTWSPLSPTLANGPSDNYSDWVNSGDIDLSSYSDTIYLAFRYTGSDPSATTTWQVDNILISEQ